MEAEAYYSLISVLGQTDTDHRRGSIKIQLNRNLILKRLQVLAVAMPETLWDDKELRGFVEDYLGAEPLLYEWYHAQPAYHVVVIMEMVRHFLKKRGYFA